MKIIVEVAPSSAGKDRILKELIDRKIVKPIISVTSRPIRNKEVNGREYHFVAKEKAEEMLRNGEFAEHRKYKAKNGDIWIYGTLKNSIDVDSDDIYCLILDFQGLKQIKEYLESLNVKNCLISIYIDVDLQTRLKRSLEREGTLTDEQCLEICRRALDDDKNVVIAKDYCDCIVKNDKDINKTINEILNMLILHNDL